MSNMLCCELVIWVGKETFTCGARPLSSLVVLVWSVTIWLAKDWTFPCVRWGGELARLDFEPIAGRRLIHEIPRLGSDAGGGIHPGLLAHRLSKTGPATSKPTPSNTRHPACCGAMRCVSEQNSLRRVTLPQTYSGTGARHGITSNNSRSGVALRRWRILGTRQRLLVNLNWGSKVPLTCTRLARELPEQSLGHKPAVKKLIPSHRRRA